MQLHMPPDVEARVLGYILCDLDPKIKVEDQILFFLVNASLHIATSNFASA